MFHMVSRMHLGGVAIVSCAVLLFACGGHKATSTAQPTKKEIRKDSDRLFEKLEQEGQEPYP